MNIYKVTQHDNNSPNAIKSFIAYSISEDEVLNINPAWSHKEEWCHSEKNVTVDYIGRRANAPLNNVIMRSFDE